MDVINNASIVVLQTYLVKEHINSLY